MKPARGLTLIEIAVVLAVIGIVAATVVVSARAGARNGYVTGAAVELRTRLAGLRTTAMSEAADHLLVVVDAPGSDASRCSALRPDRCARYFVLRDPSADWKLDIFDPDDPDGMGPATAAVVATDTFRAGVHLDLAAAPPSRPAPFAAVVTHDGALRGTCGGRTCFAVRYTARGQVLPVSKDGTAVSKPALAFVLGSDLSSETSAALRQELLVSFPGGIVKTLAF